jgi:hypothetical protein
MKLYPDVPAERNSRIARDVVILVVLIGLAWIGHEAYQRVDGIKVIATGVVSAGESVQGGFVAVADAVSGVPVIGGRFADALTSSGDATGGNVASLGVEGEHAIHRTALFVGWLLFLLPAALLLALTVPGRIRSVRVLNAAQRFLHDDGSLERRRLLAMRAACSLPIERLLAHSADPMGDLMAGNLDPLLDALYEDVGLLRPAAVG